jgi:hypothetical protein
MCDESRVPRVCVGISGDRDAPLDDVTRIDAMIDAPTVQCQQSSECTPGQPFCDLTSHTCRGCEADVECTSHVCSESTGKCVDAAASLFVAPGGDNAAACTEALPCATISGALAKLTATKRTIRVADGTYTDAFLLSAQSPILISGATASYANTILNASTTGFGGTSLDHGVEENAVTLTIEGMTFKGSAAEATRVTGGGKLTLFAVAMTDTAGGVDCNASTVVIDRSSITANNKSGGIGVASSGGGNTVTVLRTMIAANAGAGIALANASYTIVNSIIAGNAGGGVSITAPGVTRVFDFNTVVNNAGATLPTGMRCAAVVPVTNSLFAGNGTAPQIAANCGATYSLFSDVAPGGTGNRAGAPAFVNANDFHITAPSPARDNADPGATATTDFDGQPRPQGTGRDIGADEIP